MVSRPVFAGVCAAALTAALALGFVPSISAAQPDPAPAAAPQAGLTADQVAQLKQALAQAPLQGLPAMTPPGLDALLTSDDPGKKAKGEGLLKTAALTYARQVHSGRLKEADFDDAWGLRPKYFDPRPGLDAAIQQNAVPQWLAGLAPRYAGYQLLVKQLAVYRDLAAKGGWKAVPGGKAIKPGGSDKRVPLIRARLLVEDPSVPVAQAEVLDPGLTEAVKAFQRRHGLMDDGEVGSPTLEAMNVPVETRVDQIVANLERWRWMPDTLPDDRVDVNVAAAVTVLMQGGKPVLSMKAAPGRKDDQTPMLASSISAIVFNPPWNIPKSIADKEILPKEKAHPGYMAREQIHVIKTADGGQRLQQKAGTKSSLGRVKFDFDNKYGVYLHDTPSRGAFEDGRRRNVSHGCVRLEDPRGLANALLQGQGTWSQEKIGETIDAGATDRVQLDRQTAVFLFYWTAVAGTDGKMNFYRDPYDWDHELLLKLAPPVQGNA